MGCFLDLHYANIFGSRLATMLHQELSSTLSRHVLDPCSRNETNNVAMSRPECPGPVTPGMEVIICDDALHALPHGEIGMIAVRAPRVSEGYLGDPSRNARQFRAGWFRMSDLGQMPAPWQLDVLGRADDMPDVAGLKVLPYALEATLRRMARAADVAVLPARDDLGIGRLMIVFETSDAPLLESEAKSLMRVRLPGVVGKFSVHRFPKFPCTATGKLKRRELAAFIAPPLIDGQGRYAERD